MAAAWCGGAVLAPMTFEGYCDANLIEAWVAHQLVTEVRAGQTVILDNASFHRIEPLRRLLEQVDCSVRPLPPYSPDLNAIEPLWNQIKHKIMLDDRPHQSFRHKVEAAFV
jgi:transposase